MIRTACLTYQIDEGVTVSIEQQSELGLLLEWAGDELFGLLHNVGYEWAYKVRWGPIDPEYGLALDKCLGSKIFGLGQWFGNGFGAYRWRKQLAKIPVTTDWVRENFPDAGWPWDGTELEDDDA